MGSFCPHHFHIKTFEKLTDINIKLTLKIFLAIGILSFYIVKLPTDAYTIIQAGLFLCIFTIRMSFYPLVISWLQVIIASFSKFGGSSKFFLSCVALLVFQGIFFNCFVTKKEQDIKAGKIRKIPNWNHIWFENAIKFSIILICIFAIIPKKKPTKNNIRNSKSEEKTLVKEKVASSPQKANLSRNIKKSAILLNTKNAINNNKSKRSIYKQIEQISEEDAKQISKLLGYTPKSKRHAQAILKDELLDNPQELRNAIDKQHQKLEEQISKIILSELSTDAGGAGAGGAGAGGAGAGGARQQSRGGLQQKVSDSLGLAQLANQMENKEDGAKISQNLEKLDEDTLEKIHSAMGFRSDSNNKEKIIADITQKYEKNPIQSKRQIDNLVRKELKSIDRKLEKLKNEKDPKIIPELKTKKFRLSKDFIFIALVILGVFILILLSNKQTSKNIEDPENNSKISKKHAKKTKKSLLKNCQHLKKNTPKTPQELIQKTISLYNSLMNYIIQCGHERPSSLTPDQYEIEGLHKFCQDKVHARFVTKTFVETLYGKKPPNIDEFQKYVSHIQILCVAIEQSHQKLR